MGLFIQKYVKEAYCKNIGRVISVIDWEVLLTIPTSNVMIPLMHNMGAITESEQI